MNYCRRSYRSALAGIALIAGLGFFTTSALAQFLPSGTTTTGGISANTDITNQATLNYTIGGTGQPAVISNTTTFKVDNKVNVVVTEVGGTFTAVAPNATGQVTTFTVTNAGNSPMDFVLTPNGAIANGLLVTLGGTPYSDSNITAGFDVSGCNAFVESGGSAGFQGAQDVNRAIRNLSPVAPGNTLTVYVVCTVPSSATATPNGNNALVSLTATTANDNTCVLPAGTGCVTTVATAGADNPAAVDVVFADAAGSDDGVNNGQHSARDVYQVAAALISVSKTVTPICDPFNGSINPKSIPGAFVQYEITIANAPGAAPATLTDVSDALNANTVFDPNLRLGTGGSAPNMCTSSNVASAAGSGFRLRCTGTARTGGAGTCADAGGQFFTTGADGDAAFFAAGSVTVRFGTGGGTVTGAQALPAQVAGVPYTAGELKGGEAVTIRFNAIIN
ncbi:MAG TPA: hypothetical protein VK642_15005 [Burkholderiales bacterium]|nr:hypothetical protein [Burkholderiales bacterium]